jgi:hypothetical protein
MRKSHRAFCGAFTIAFSLSLAACSTRRSESSNEQLLRATIPPGVQSPIAVKTRPTSMCVVRAAEGGEQNSVARFFADERGNARFFVRPNDGTESTTRLAVHCESPGGNTDQTVELRASKAPNSEYPAPPALPAPEGKARRALTKDEAANMSDEELIKNGYPLPPDERLSPNEYDIWLRDVTTQRICCQPRSLHQPLHETRLRQHAQWAIHFEQLERRGIARRKRPFRMGISLVDSANGDRRVEDPNEFIDLGRNRRRWHD